MVSGQTECVTQPTRSTAPSRPIVIHAVIAFVAAHLVVVLLHELSHVVAGLALGYDNELYAFSVVHSPEPGRADAAIMALTGPAFSLVTGVLAVLVQPFRRTRGFVHLWWLWFAFMSVMEGVGYLLLTPFGVGDTGSTADAYDAPALVSWTCFALSIAGLFVLAMRFGAVAVRHTAGDLQSLRAFTFYPWMIGTVVALVLTVLDLALVGDVAGGDLVAVIAGSFAIGVFAPMTMPFATRRAADETPAAEPMSFRGTPFGGIVVIVVVTLINIVLLAPGLGLG